MDGLPALITLISSIVTLAVLVFGSIDKAYPVLIPGSRDPKRVAFVGAVAGLIASISLGVWTCGILLSQPPECEAIKTGRPDLPPVGQGQEFSAPPPTYDFGSPAIGCSVETKDTNRSTSIKLWKLELVPSPASSQYTPRLFMVFVNQDPTKGDTFKFGQLAQVILDAETTAGTQDLTARQILTEMNQPIDDNDKVVLVPPRTKVTRIFAFEPVSLPVSEFRLAFDTPDHALNIDLRSIQAGGSASADACWSLRADETVGECVEQGPPALGNRILPRATLPILGLIVSILGTLGTGMILARLLLPRQTTQASVPVAPSASAGMTPPNGAPSAPPSQVPSSERPRRSFWPSRVWARLPYTVRDWPASRSHRVLLIAILVCILATASIGVLYLWVIPQYHVTPRSKTVDDTSPVLMGWATCAADETLISGGYRIEPTGLRAASSYPKDLHTWEVVVHNTASTRARLRVTVYCLKSNRHVEVERVAGYVIPAKPMESPWDAASCDKGAELLSGGFLLTSSADGFVGASTPYIIRENWNNWGADAHSITSNVTSFKAYALCATQGIRVERNWIKQTLTIAPQGVNSIIGRCLPGLLAVGGGWGDKETDSATSEQPIAVDYNDAYDAASGAPSQWRVEAKNTDSNQEHTVDVWTVCVRPPGS